MTLAAPVLKCIAGWVPLPGERGLAVAPANLDSLRGVFSAVSELRTRLPRSPSALRHIYGTACEQIDRDLATSQDILRRAIEPAAPEQAEIDVLLASAAFDEGLPDDAGKLGDLAAAAWRLRQRTLQDQWVDTSNFSRLQAAFELCVSRWMERVCATGPVPPERTSGAVRSTARRTQDHPDVLALRVEGQRMARALGGISMAADARAIVAHRWLDLSRAEPLVSRREQLANLLAGLVSASHDGSATAPGLVIAVLDALADSAPVLSRSVQWVLSGVLLAVGGADAHPAHVAPIMATLARLQSRTAAPESRPGASLYSGNPT